MSTRSFPILDSINRGPLPRMASVVIKEIEIQYNWSLISPSFLKHAKLRSARTSLGDKDAVALQSNCVQRTCSRSLHGNCLERGSNPSSPHYRQSATNRPLCRCWSDDIN